MMQNYESQKEINWEGCLTLVRHGTTDSNDQDRFTGGASDPPLNKKGKEQAKQSAELLLNWSIKNKINFDLMLSSPLKRCIDTANEFKKLFDLEITKEPLLIERNYGIFEGLSHEEASEKYPDIFFNYQKDKPFVTLPQGESGYDVEDRIERLLFTKLPIEFKTKKDILIISHLNPIRAIFRQLGLADWDIYYKYFNNVSVSRIKIKNKTCEFEFCDTSPLS